MSSLADQMKALGLEPVRQPKEDVVKPRSKSRPNDRSRSHENLLLQLPRFGTVDRLVEEKGFGFLTTGGEDVFFHAKGFAGVAPDGQKLPPRGTQVLFITGSDPRRANKEEKGAVRWAPAEAVLPTQADLPTDQRSLDELRRKRLDELPREALWQILEAAWYTQRWRGEESAPADLEDPVLELVFGERLKAMHPAEITKANVRRRINNSRYRFAVRLSPEHPRCNFEQLLALCKAEQLAAMGAPDPAWMRTVPKQSTARLLEWHLLSRHLHEQRGDWASWFSGSSASELDVARAFVDRAIEPDAFTCEWLGKLAQSGHLTSADAEKWAELNRPELALAMFEKLPPSRQAAMLAAWRIDPKALDVGLKSQPSRAYSLLAATALSVDLETDGTRVWEVGYALNGQPNLLHDEQSDTQFQAAMMELGALIRAAPLLVGHNMLAWDWPIIARMVGPGPTPVIWDTLLIEYLLAPNASSHALGGSHHAHDDALIAAQLFERQLQTFPDSVARAILVGEISTTNQLLKTVADCLSSSVRVASEPPAFLLGVGEPSNRLVIVPEHRLRETDWVPGTRVVAADPQIGLSPAWRHLDMAALEEGIGSVREPGPTALILLAVARLAHSQGVHVRKNMIPTWLLDGDNELTSIVEAACVDPAREGGWLVASAPQGLDWWTNANPESYTVGGMSEDVLVLQRRQMPPSDIKLDTSKAPNATFMCMGVGEVSPLWLIRDRAAHTLDPRGGLNSFRTLVLDSAGAAPEESQSAPFTRPMIATRRHHVLYPRAEDQASYWEEVLRTVCDVASHSGDAVPVLLVVSTVSKSLVDLLATGLAELGVGEVKPDHRSKREHLLRASMNGLCLVDTIDQWPQWQAIAESAGVLLQPIVEALPIEEWYACAEARATNSDAKGTRPAAENAGDVGGLAVIDAALVLEKLPSLVDTMLQRWMTTVGLALSVVPVVLIDPRIGSNSKSFTRLSDQMHLQETPLPDEMRQRLAIVLSPFTIVREEAPSGYEAMEEFLVSNWQPRADKGSYRVTGFKDSQRTAMQAISSRSANVLVSLPTGEGKSVLFQVPALCRGLRNRRLTLVLSPLKALMRDQVERLREQGFAESADYLSGDRPQHEISEIVQGVLDHRIVMLYVAPERLRSEVFLDVLQKRMQADGGLEHVIVDETHCVNQWGYEFRPDYFHALNLLLGKCREMDLTEPTPFVLLSATITASDRARLQSILAGESGGVAAVLPLLVRPETFSNPLRAHIAVKPRRVRGSINDRREFPNALAERLPLIHQAITEALKNRAATGQRSAVIIFVSSREHAEAVAQRLASDGGGRVDYYHAGLDSGTREEIYTRFLDGELDVLVATKAFGMGMDIPDIHWVVHLSPPGYLEDYLQEVGRIGRGAREREKAGLENLSAVLLFSDLDFEAIRGMRAKSALSVPGIKDLHEQIKQNSYEMDGAKIAIVPSEGYESPEDQVRVTAASRRSAATRVRMSLYWLERAQRIKLCGSVPDLVTVAIHQSALKTLSLEEGQIGQVAGLILETVATGTFSVAKSNSFHATSNIGNPQAMRRPAATASGGIFGGIMSALGNFLGSLVDTVGIMINSSSRPLTQPAAPIAASHKISDASSHYPADSGMAVLNLSQIRRRIKSFESVGDVLACLTDLEKRGGLTWKRDVRIVPRRLAAEPHERIGKLFDYVDGAVRELIRRLRKKSRLEFNPFEMVEDIEGPEVDSEQRNQYERAFINGFRSLARASGVKLRQIVREDNKVIWEGMLAQSAARKADVHCSQIRKGAQSLFEVVREEKSIPISTLISTLRSKSSDGRFRESDLKKTVGLLSALCLVSISPDLIPLSHVVMLSDTDGKLEDQVGLWEELKQVNDLAEARNLAMEVFANLDANAHAGFIEGYFTAQDANGLKAFLETQLGEVATEDGDEGPSGVISQMLEKLRATKAVEFFERFKLSEEPAQWEAARYPFDQHLLVNAGPGAGKTFVLVGRIAHLIREQNIDPSQIIVLAFNRAVVFEIKRRIRELFKSLGYAPYAARLRVSTFHAFAISNLARVDGVRIQGPNVDSVLATFASRMEDDPAFRQSVAAGVRSVLVDEFQDVTENVYSVIRNLHLGSGSRAGVMVIGDDDQDILRWQRKSDGSKHEFSEDYFERFEKDFGGDELGRFVLAKNFRSDKLIVERSQAFVSNFFQRSKRSRRLKDSRLVARSDAAEGTLDRIDWKGHSWDDAVKHAATALTAFGVRPGESTAVLCRSNAEVAEAHRLLSSVMPDLAVQGSANLRIAEMRHVGMWIDFLRRAASQSDRALSKELKRHLFQEFLQSAAIPEVLRPESAAIQLEDLWELCYQEQAFPHLTSLIRFVEELRSDDLGRLAGLIDSKSKATVSTLHKVKGLEFDNVIILPSSIRFGGADRGARSADVAGDAAEEARLLYVGMTRAKRHLMYFVGDRETSWGRSLPEVYDGLTSDGRVLQGAMDDVGLGWALQKNYFNPSPDACQEYIESEVAVGDPIELGGAGAGAGKAFMHRSASGKLVQIGFLAQRHKVGGSNAQMKVSAVVRFRPTDMDSSMAQCVRERGWGYVVLVSGRLR